MKTAYFARTVCLASVAGLACIALPATSGEAKKRVSSSVTGVLLSDIHFAPLSPTLTPDATTLENDLIAAQDNNWDKDNDTWDAAKWDAIFAKKATYPTAFPYPADANYPLMMSALSDAASKSPEGIVIYTGDLMPHDFTGSLAFKATTAIYAVQKMQQAFKVPVIVALGNNDSVCGDYARFANDPTFAALAKFIKVVRDAKDPEVRVDFKYGGFYAIPDPSVADQDLVVLNTSFWSAQAPTPPLDKTTPLPVIPQVRGMPSPGAVELWWLQSRLEVARARNRKVRLIMHIPPGIDAYKSQGGDTKRLWKEKYETGFLTLMRQFQKTVVTSFAGHTHQDEFRVVSDDSGNPFLVFRITPAVSTLNHNNPGYSVLTYNQQTGDVDDITTYYSAASSPPSAPNPITDPCAPVASSNTSSSWQCEYQFTREYREYDYHAFSAANLYDLAAKIQAQGKALPTKGTTFAAWQMLYDVSAAKPEFDDPQWSYFSCAQTKFTKKEYDACVQGDKR